MHRDIHRIAAIKLEPAHRAGEFAILHIHRALFHGLGRLSGNWRRRGNWRRPALSSDAGGRQKREHMVRVEAHRRHPAAEQKRARRIGNEHRNLRGKILKRAMPVFRGRFLIEDEPFAVIQFGEPLLQPDAATKRKEMPAR